MKGKVFGGEDLSILLSSILDIWTGTFHARDKLRTLKEFVQSQLDNGWQPFILTDPTNVKLTDDDAMLAALHLVCL